MISIDSPSGRWQPFCNQIESFLAADTIELSIDGTHVQGYRSPDSASLWLRDHSDIIRGGRYFAGDMRAVVDAFVATQATNGRVFDFVTCLPTTGSSERENWEKWVRVPVEADVEYRLVAAAYRTWQTNGDDDWMSGLVPALEAALEYSTSHPLRWDDKHKLVKRPYTIDTWDFDYTAGKHEWLNFQITDDTIWGIMHGDNSGVYEALQMLAAMHRRLGNAGEAMAAERKAVRLRNRANELLFNGDFYTHFHKLSNVNIFGVDEAAQLSLSNPMNINRGLASQDMADAILKTYQKRAATNDTFAEWYSIDPPFPAGIFGDEKLIPGSYCNGGIMPLVGGELAKAALENGHEKYGVSILEKYRKLIESSGETYLWYFPDGTASTVETSTSPDAMPTDGWGSSAMLWALAEGLAGVIDKDVCFKKVHLAPRWIAADEKNAHVRISYPASSASFEYKYALDEESNSIIIDVKSESELSVHLMLPYGTRPVGVSVGSHSADFTESTVGDSSYVDFQARSRGPKFINVEYAG